MGQGHSIPVGGFPTHLQMGFLIGATEKRALPSTPQLTWKHEDPVWTEQWPLLKAKLCTLKALVEEQLAKGHITETTSTWNFLVFVLKKTGKDR